MKNKIGLAFMVLGAAMILSAVALCLFNVNESKSAGESAVYFLSEIKPDNDGADKEDEEPPSLADKESSDSVDGFYSAEMKTVTIDGYDFIGYLTFPTLGLELPVMAKTTDAQLDISPCRYYGSVKTDDLVIGGHNFASHFGHISDLSEGDSILFTDIDGKVYSFEAITYETLGSGDVDYLCNGEYDLSLFTCDYSGRNRFTLRCNRAEN